MGVSPALPPIPVKKNRDVCGERKEPEALILGPDKGVKDVVIL